MHFTTYFTDKWSFAEVVIKRERRKLFLNHKLYQAGWVVCMPQRMIVCRGRVQKGDILDSHSFPSVIIQSVLSLRFPNWSFCNSKCSFDHVSFQTKYWLKNRLEHGQTLKRVKTLSQTKLHYPHFLFEIESILLMSDVI